MSAISSLPIRRQLFVLLTLALGFSLLLSGAGMAVYESFTYGPRLLAQLRGNAAMMAEMLAPAVDFADESTATRQLAILNQRNDVLVSAIYLADGTLFAAQASATGSPRIAERVPPARVDGTERDGAIALLQPIRIEQRKLGTLWLVMKTPSLDQRLAKYATLALVSLFSLLCLAVLLSFGLRKAISDPIRRLSDAAQAVSDQENYSVRVQFDAGNNEMGRLAAAFNQMLGAVDSRERENHERQRRLARQTEGMAELVRLEDEAREDIPGALQRFAGIMAQVQQVDRVGIWLIGEGSEQLTCAAGYDRKAGTPAAMAGLDLQTLPLYAEALRANRVVEIADFQDEPLGRELRAARPEFAAAGAMLDVPVRRRGRIVGVLCHLQLGAPRRWCPEEVRFAEFAADHVALLFEAREAQLATDSLQASEERFRHLVENSSELISLIDEAGRYHYASPNHAALVGIAPPAIVGRSIFEFAHSLDLAPADLARFFRGDARESRLTFRFRCGDGAWRWFESSGRRFGTVAGEMRAVLVSRDVTEQRLSQERFASIFNHSPVGLAITSLDTGVILDINDAAARLIDDSGERVIGMSTERFGFWHAGERQQFVQKVAVERRLCVMERPLQRRDGTNRIVQAHFAAIEVGGQSCLLVALLDVTENRRAEATLRESEERYRTLIDEAKDAIFTLALDGRVLELNEAVQTITGWDRRLWIGRGFLEALDPEDRPRAREVFTAVTAGEHPPSFELRIRARNGVMLEFEFAISAHYKDGKIAGLLGIGRDITERKRAALAQSRLEAQLRQAQKMESLGTLAGGIAHDFNNMLTGIMGNTQLASMDLPENHPVQEYLRGAARSSARARSLVRQILTFSRQSEQKVGPLRIDLLLKESLELLRASLPATIVLVPRIERDLPMILGDPTMLHQIVLNLVTNAYHAIGERETGRIELVAEVTTVDEAMVAQKRNLRLGRWVRLTVTDSGCGMDAATVERIFEPFFTTKEAGKGTGLGLSVVHGIMEQHKGAIVVYSAVGRGTSFQLYFPIATDDQAPPSSAPGEEPTVIPGQGRVLMVDDEEIVLHVGKRFLEKAGYTVVTFSDARAAHHELATRFDDYDLVVVDLTMPGFKGTTLAGLVRELRPDLPVLLATGFAGELSSSSLAELNVSGMLLKPFTCQQLTGEARRVITAARLSRLH